jgi:hypothetical protein
MLYATATAVMSRTAIWRAAEALVAPYNKDQRRKCSKLRAQGVCGYMMDAFLRSVAGRRKTLLDCLKRGSVRNLCERQN